MRIRVELSSLVKSENPTHISYRDTLLVHNLNQKQIRFQIRGSQR